MIFCKAGYTSTCRANCLTDKATARTLTTLAALDARHLGLEVSEIEEDLGSLERVIFEALDQPDI
ncbi:hypothetical protein ACWGTO_29845 [Mesorhizobium sp. PL10]